MEKTRTDALNPLKTLVFKKALLYTCSTLSPRKGALSVEKIQDRTLDVSLQEKRGFVSGCMMERTPGKRQSRSEARCSGAAGVLDGRIFPFETCPDDWRANAKPESWKVRCQTCPKRSEDASHGHLLHYPGSGDHLRSPLFCPDSLSSALARKFFKKMLKSV